MTRHPDTLRGGRRAGARRRRRRRSRWRPPRQGCDAAYYLVHSLDQPTFEAGRRGRPRGRSPRRRPDAGLTRIVYLGGLGDDDDDLSAHLRSRREVEKLLGSGGGAGDDPAGGHHRRPRRDLLGDDPAARRAPARDDHAPLGAHPDPADRGRRRRPLPGRGAGVAGGGRSGVRHRRPGGPGVRRDDAPGRPHRGPQDADRAAGAAAHPVAVVALAVAGDRRRRADRPVAGRLDDQRGGRPGRQHPQAGAVRADGLRQCRAAGAG